MTAILALAVISVPTTVEAAKKEKCYKASVDGWSEYYNCIPEQYLSYNDGRIVYANGGYLDLTANKGTTIYYTVKKGTTKASAVKAPTIKSAKIESKKTKTFKITKNTTIKFKVVKGKATKAKIKKAKTYYVVCKVQKKTNFMETLPTGSTVIFNYCGLAGLAVNTKVCDKVVYTVNGGKKQTEKGSTVYFSAYGPTTLKVTGYKMGKKLGTYTYNYDVKTYAPKSVHDYKLKGSYTDPQYCTWKFDVPYGDGYALAYTTDGSTPSLTNGTFISDLTQSCGSYVDMYESSNALDISYIRYDKDGKTTFKAQLYKKVYYKVDNGAYKFAGYEPYGGVTAHTYTTFRRFCDDIETATENFPNTTCFYDAKNVSNDSDKEVLALCIDYKGYVKTYTLKAGERLSDHTKYGACVLMGIYYKVDGKFDHPMTGESFERWAKDAGNLQARNITLTAEDFRKSLTDNPTRLTVDQTFNDLQSYIIFDEKIADATWNAETKDYVWYWTVE